MLDGSIPIFLEFFSTFHHSGTCTKGENGANYIHLFCTNAYTYFSSVNNGTTPVIKPQISTFTHSVKNTEFYSHWKMVPFDEKFYKTVGQHVFSGLFVFLAKIHFWFVVFCYRQSLWYPQTVQRFWASGPWGRFSYQFIRLKWSDFIQCELPRCSPQFGRQTTSQPF